MTQAANATAVSMEINRTRALELRLAGKTYREIRDELRDAATGEPMSLTRVYEYVQEGLAEAREVTAETATAVRHLEVERCDRLLKKLDGLPFSARVADSILKTMERRSKYLGLDAPTKWEGSGPNGAPLLPPGGVVIQLVSPGQVPPPAPAPVDVATDGE